MQINPPKIADMAEYLFTCIANNPATTITIIIWLKAMRLANLRPCSVKLAINFTLDLPKALQKAPKVYLSAAHLQL